MNGPFPAPRPCDVCGNLTVGVYVDASGNKVCRRCVLPIPSSWAQRAVPRAGSLMSDSSGEVTEIDGQLYLTTEVQP